LPKKTIEDIVNSGNDYVIKVKANQPKLHLQIQQHTQQQEPIQSHNAKERTRNRQSERIVKVFAPPDDLDPKWSEVGCVIRVERKGMRGDVPYERIGFYISSLAPNSQRIAMGIRQHWGIENRLHWVKDVVYEEDSSPQKAGFAPINLSLLKTWVLTLMRIHGFDSLTEAISSLSHNIKQILSFCH
jgi:predicted transposase YbfD/YdcC